MFVVVCSAFGGPGVQNAILGFATLFSLEYQSTCTSLLTGSFQLSFLLFYIFDLCWEANKTLLNVHTLFGCYMMFTIFQCGITLFLWPHWYQSNFDDEDSNNGLEIPSRKVGVSITKIVDYVSFNLLLK